MVKRHLSPFREDVLKRIKTASHSILFLDYDGTLVPIRKEPSLARLSSDTREVLRRLSCIPSLAVGIISGRSLREIRKLVGITSLFYAGNHGFEMLFQNRVWVHPALGVFTAELKSVARGVEESTRNIAGILVENKTITLSVHYRNVRGHTPRSIFSIIAGALEPYPGHFTIVRGKKVYEVRPRIDWDKGRAVEEITRLVALKTDPLKIYLGDDQTDEDAFRVLARGDISIRVGYKKGSGARYFCRGSGEVTAFLKALNSALITR